MQIELKLNKDFERTLNALRIKYGSDFELLNGVDESQLDYTEFLQHFVSAHNLADASIDPNANSSHRDIRSFMTEKSKSADKLFGLNKIFIEIKKFFGLKTAKNWLEQEFSKGFYLNDSTSASLFPYCWAQDLSRLARKVYSFWITIIINLQSILLHFLMIALSLFHFFQIDRVVLLDFLTFLYGHIGFGREM